MICKTRKGIYTLGSNLLYLYATLSAGKVTSTKMSTNTNCLIGTFGKVQKCRSKYVFTDADFGVYIRSSLVTLWPVEPKAVHLSSFGVVGVKASLAVQYDHQSLLG